MVVHCYLNPLLSFYKWIVWGKEFRSNMVREISLKWNKTTRYPSKNNHLTTWNTSHRDPRQSQSMLFTSNDVSGVDTGGESENDQSGDRDHVDHGGWGDE